MSGHIIIVILGVLACVLVVGSAPVVAELARRYASVRQGLGLLSGSLGMMLAVFATAVPGMAGDEAPATPAPMPAGVMEPTSASSSGQSDQPLAPPTTPQSSSSMEEMPPSSTEDALTAPPVSGSQVIIPPGRPAWVEARPVREGPLHTSAVQSEMHAREQDCWNSLDQALLAATRDYIAEQLDDSRAPLFFHYSIADIKSRFVKPENVYHEVVQVSFGPMHQAHALLEFPADFRSEIHVHWQQVQRAGRLVKIGIGAIGLVALLSILYGYLRVDTATRGYYTSRLQFLTAAAILAVIIASVLIVRSGDAWIQWLL